MSTNLEAKKHPGRTRVEEQTRRQRRVIRTTLGDLIVALTDEVMPFVREPSALYPVVSYLFNDVLARHRLGATPLGRAGTLDEITKTVLFLASHDSSYLNGIELFVDGGAAQI